MQHVPGAFSITARDPEANVYGAAVTTGTITVGATCPYMSAGDAAVTQSYTEPEHGRNTVARTEAGKRIDDAFESLLDDDDHAAYRQVHSVGAGGEFAFTGGECVSWAGHRVGGDYTVTGNILAGEGIIETTTEAYETADGDMAERLVSTLEASGSAGDDDRGELNAALLVHAPTPEFYHNLRVDLSDDPVADLRGLLSETRRTRAQIRRETDTQFGDYPDKILEFGVKY